MLTTHPVSAPPSPLVPAAAVDEAPLAPHLLTALVKVYHAPLYRYAFRLSGDAQEAEDLVQQTFLVAHRRGGCLRQPDRAGAWLYAVLRNAYLKHCRRKQPVAASTVELDLDGLPGSTIPERWEGRDLQSALDALPPEYKVVVLMFYFEDASYKEIADQLQIPIGTVMSRLSRAKATLRGLLLEHRTSPNAAPLLRPTGDRS